MMTNEKSTKNVFVDSNECTGCEACVASVPNVFRMTAYGISEVYNSQGDTEIKIQDAIDSCPVSCIHWKS
jgi:ferredoxin